MFSNEQPAPARASDTGESRPLEVSQLNRQVRLALERGYRDVWVQGELSDVTLASSGHAYFTLNDSREAAQVRCVMFRADLRRAPIKLEDGQMVQVRGSLSLYEPRGSFQLIVRSAVPGGQGDLHAEFERIKKRLMADGLLDPARKRPLPRLPSVVGVVTSVSGAALHDILHVTAKRCPVRVVVSPCLVQGADAPASIRQALARVQQLPEVQVIIVGRGGGSAEDLFAFNDEAVARAIAACRVPVVSAVGHEVDVTIADLVADVRAATPSNAAELVVPEYSVLTQELGSLARALQRALEVHLGRARLTLDRVTHRLMDPRRALFGIRSRLDTLRGRMIQATHRRLQAFRASLKKPSEELVRLDSRRVLARNRASWTALTSQLRSLGKTSMVRVGRAQLTEVVAQLHALSPLAILARGYSITLRSDNGSAITSIRQTAPGELVRIRLHEGALQARIEEVLAEEPRS